MSKKEKQEQDKLDKDISRIRGDDARKKLEEDIKRITGRRK